MASFKIRRCIRLDHTFKVASNIGSDGKWVALYGMLFIVLNEDGIVVGWQFTRSTSLEEVKPLLLALKERIELPERTSLTVYVVKYEGKVNKYSATMRYSVLQDPSQSSTLSSCHVFMTSNWLLGIL